MKGLVGNIVFTKEVSRVRYPSIDPGLAVVRDEEQNLEKFPGTEVSVTLADSRLEPIKFDESGKFEIDCNLC